MAERDKFDEKNFRLCFHALSRNSLANDFTFSLIKFNRIT